MASYDLLIIGAGPAAWSCAMTARQRGLTTAVACAQSATSWLQRAERIDNYPGLPQISGKELLSRFRAQAADMGVVIIEQLARQIMPSGDVDMTLDEVLREFTVAVPDWAREKAGITADTKLDCEASEDAGVIAVYPASYRHDLTDVPRSILQCLLASGHSLYALNDILTAESENSDAE